MNPKAAQIAMEQMRRMTPEQMSRMQQQMGNVTPEMMQTAMSQMGSMSTSEWDQMANKMNTIDPNTIADMSGNIESHFQAQQNYLHKGSFMLKEEGNKHFKAGSYSQAVEMYKKAKANVEKSTSPDMKELKRACALNLANCFLNMQQYTPCVQECTEVLQEDGENVKALYRRGRAYLGLKKLTYAERDLKMALKLLSGDSQQADMIQAHLKDVQDRIENYDGIIEEIEDEPLANNSNNHQGVVIEEIVDDEDKSVPRGQAGASSRLADDHCSASDSTYTDNMHKMASIAGDSPAALKDMVKENPEMLKEAAEVMAKMSDDDLVSMGKSTGLNVSPEMVRAAQAAMSDMDMDTLKQMAGMAGMMTKGRGDRVFDINPTPAPMPSSQSPGGRVESRTGSNSGVPEAGSMGSDSMFSPEMMKAASEIMSGLSPEDLSKMGEMAGGMQSKQDIGSLLNANNMPNDPAMLRSMFKVMRSLDDDTVASMLASSGMCGDQAQAKEMARKMKSMSDNQAEMMIKAARVVQSGASAVKKTKNFLLGKAGLILALAMIVVGVLLRYMGWM